MRRALWIGLVLLVAGSALPVEAASAEFQGNCTNIAGTPLQTWCAFDAQRTPSGSTPTSCSPSFVSTYFWDFGDGTSFFTSNDKPLHIYYGQGAWWIDLGVFCADGSSDVATHCMVNYIGIYGCILPGGGWMP